MLYFKGCTAREKELDISKNTEKLLKLLNIDYNTLENEKCCGSVLLRTGFIDEAKSQIKKNTKIFKNETIITSCAGCYKTLKEDYDNIDVIHISQLINKLIKENKIYFKKQNLNVTYHDSCHLARHCGEYEAPRNIIKEIANLIEMDYNRENALCCGAGGGVKSAYPEIADSLSKNRIDEALKTKCELLITTCPFCKLNLKNNSIEVLDLCEFIIKYGEIK